MNELLRIRLAWDDVAEDGRPSTEAGEGMTEGLMTFVSPPWFTKYSLLDCDSMEIVPASLTCRVMIRMCGHHDREREKQREVGGGGELGGFTRRC